MSRFEIAPWLRYECVGCGACCRRGLDIWCPAAEHKRLAAVDWAAADPRLAGELFLPTPHGYRFALTEDGACRFLADDNRCLMHAAIGFERKVLTCKIYPFNLVRSYGRIHVGLLFSCPAVVDGIGPPVAEQVRLLTALADETDRYFPPRPGEDDAPFAGRRRLTFPDLRRLEDALVEILGDATLPFVRRVIGAGDLLDRLEETEDAALGAADFREHLAYLAGKARERAANDGLAKPSPGPFERFLLRQFQGLCASLRQKGLHSRAFWTRQGARWRRLRLALRYSWGDGPLPTDAGVTTFAAARRVSAFRLPPESEELLARYLRARIAARQYFGRESWGLAALPGARLTLALAAVALWHAKAFAAAAGRTDVTHADVRSGVLLTDHTFGHLAEREGASSRAMAAASRAGWPQQALLSTILGR